MIRMMQFTGSHYFGAQVSVIIKSVQVMQHLSEYTENPGLFNLSRHICMEKNYIPMKTGGLQPLFHCLC